MCAHPGCKPAADTFQLKGPAGKPPQTGWALLELPIEDSAIKSAWQTYRTVASGPTDAVYQAEKFLKVNGIEGMKAVLESYAVDQWCRPEPWRCRGYDPDAPVATHPNLPWAKAMWEDSNKALNDSVDDADAPATLGALVQNLTSAIEGPEGCPKCAGHWSQYLKGHPPVVAGLAEARQWLWKAHNHTREGKVPVPFEEIAAKFNWN